MPSGDTFRNDAILREALSRQNTRATWAPGHWRPGFLPCSASPKNFSVFLLRHQRVRPIFLSTDGKDDDVTSYDKRPEHLGWVEVALQTANPGCPELRISAQSHHGSRDRIAFVDIFGVDDDTLLRRKLRADASALLMWLGYTVEIEPGLDIYDIEPIRPASAHERLRMLECLRSSAPPVPDPRI